MKLHREGVQTVFWQNARRKLTASVATGRRVAHVPQNVATPLVGVENDNVRLLSTHSGILSASSGPIPDMILPIASAGNRGRGFAEPVLLFAIVQNRWVLYPVRDAKRYDRIQESAR